MIVGNKLSLSYLFASMFCSIVTEHFDQLFI